MNAADNWADAGTPRSSAREGLQSSYGVGILNLRLLICITYGYRNLSLFPATIVVSTERENEFEQYVRTSQAGTRERTRQDDEENDAK